MKIELDEHFEIENKEFRKRILKEISIIILLGFASAVGIVLTVLYASEIDLLPIEYQVIFTLFGFFCLVLFAIRNWVKNELNYLDQK